MWEIERFSIQWRNFIIPTSSEDISIELISLQISDVENSSTSHRDAVFMPFDEKAGNAVDR